MGRLPEKVRVVKKLEDRMDRAHHFIPERKRGAWNDNYLGELLNGSKPFNRDVK